MSSVVFERSDPSVPVVQAVLAELPQLDRRSVLAVKGDGETVTAVAARLGLERTRRSKILNRALGRVDLAVAGCAVTPPAHRNG